MSNVPPHQEGGVKENKMKANTNTVICPQCGNQIELSEALAKPLVERLRAEIEQQASETILTIR